jgi:putative endonuclease
MGIAEKNGAAGETLAASYLALRGCEVVARNTRIAGIEVDVIADEGPTRVLVEVKFRSRDDYGGAALAVSRLQSERLKRAARAVAGETRRPVRIDVIALELADEGLALRHYRGAIPDAG